MNCIVVVVDMYVRSGKLMNRIVLQEDLTNGQLVRAYTLSIDGVVCLFASLLRQLA